jgi:hypothetical protein
MSPDELTYQQLVSILDKWIEEKTEISKAARRARARLPDEDDRFQLSVEVSNMANYFGRNGDIKNVA